MRFDTKWLTGDTRLKLLLQRGHKAFILHLTVLHSPACTCCTVIVVMMMILGCCQLAHILLSVHPTCSLHILSRTDLLMIDFLYMAYHTGCRHRLHFKAITREGASPLSVVYVGDYLQKTCWCTGMWSRLQTLG